MRWCRDGIESCWGAGLSVSGSPAERGLGLGSFWILLSQEGLCSSCGGPAVAVGVFSSPQTETGSLCQG